MLRNFGIQVPDEMVEEFITSKSRTGKVDKYDTLQFHRTATTSINTPYHIKLKHMK